MKEPIVKKIESTGDVCIKFTDEELAALNLTEGDKFSIKYDDKGIFLEKFVPVEINLSDFNRETLEFLIASSVEEDISINDVINNALSGFLKKIEDEDPVDQV
jgi:hypothetical protein